MTGIPIIPRHGENYERHWGFADYRGKSVLDLGADNGSTASWFLRHGARTVIAVEGNPTDARQLQANILTGKLPSTVAIHMMIKEAAQLQALLDDNSADIVKIDIEGAEDLLRLVPSQTIRKHPEYAVESHTREIKEHVEAAFEEAGFTKMHDFVHDNIVFVEHFRRTD